MPASPSWPPSPSWIAFSGPQRVDAGSPRAVAASVKAFADANSGAPILIFDAVTSRPVEIDLRGTPSDVLARLEQPASDAAAGVQEPRPPGRPKLGVVAREVTLLPRHWEWLGSQPGGASVALRKLVDEARRSNGDDDARRQAQESAYRFMHAMAGDEPGFEEASRALFANQHARLAMQVQAWPADIRDHVLTLASRALSTEAEDTPVS